MGGKRSRGWRLAVGVLLAGSAAGCQTLGALVYATAGPLPVDPMYKLADRTTLIVVEDAAHPGVNELDADILAKDVSDDLTEEKAATLVDADKLQRLRDTDAARYHTLTISDLARITGASQVVYVNLQDSTAGVESSGSAGQARATARVRVVDAGTGRNSWPVDERLGYPVSVELRFDQVDENRLVEQHAVLLEKLATYVSRLFFSYQPESDSGRESMFDTDNQLDVKKEM